MYGAAYIAGRTLPGPLTVVVKVKFCACPVVLVNGITSYLYVLIPGGYVVTIGVAVAVAVGLGEIVATG